MEPEDSSEEEEEEIDDEEIEWRHGMTHQQAQERKDKEIEVMEVEDEGRSGEESESESESVEYTDILSPRCLLQDKDEEIYKRDFSVPTLEDHFNNTILPKVMQVRNFGQSGRTKYTHLVDQDTFVHGAQKSAQNTKVFKQKAAEV